MMLLKVPLRTHELQDVPLAPGERMTVQVAFRDEWTLTLEPYPFGEAPFTVRADGRWMEQQTFRRALEEAPLMGLEFGVGRG